MENTLSSLIYGHFISVRLHPTFFNTEIIMYRVHKYNLSKMNNAFSCFLSRNYSILHLNTGRCFLL